MLTAKTLTVYVPPSSDVSAIRAVVDALETWLEDHLHTDLKLIAYNLRGTFQQHIQKDEAAASLLQRNLCVSLVPCNDHSSLFEVDLSMRKDTLVLGFTAVDPKPIDSCCERIQQLFDVREQ